MEYNSVSWMAKGKMQFAFVSIHPDIVPRLLNAGYKPYEDDDYADIDCIFARCREEYEMIRQIQVLNP